MPQATIGGISFDPAAQQDQKGPEALKRLRNPVQEAVQTLTYRLPKVFGARAPVDRSLLAGAGGMGQFPGGDALIAQILGTLSGLPPVPRTEPARIDSMRGSGSYSGGTSGGGSGSARGGGTINYSQPASYTQSSLPVHVGVNYDPTAPGLAPVGPAPAPAPRVDLTPTDPYAYVGPTAAEDPSDPTTWLSPYERINGPYQGVTSGDFDSDGNWVP